ncbi:hypothetical protein C3B51_20535 [Pseudoalteromonas rubra]|uniref:Uncharacterized protein n=1 Tax=Pseudoalteromonas rubra TaxID=43658 RepID=A0A4Q7DZJ0_9GAMM|nr:hypothetical protein C3B51_20535 [Pseudoalteromonas rubra]
MWGSRIMQEQLSRCAMGAATWMYFHTELSILIFQALKKAAWATFFTVLLQSVDYSTIVATSTNIALWKAPPSHDDFHSGIKKGHALY